MKAFYADEWLTIHGGDCRAVLRELPAESVHCVVTSPPYWGLRDYGTAAWEGGEADCDHALPRRRTYTPDDAKEAIVPSVRPGDPGNLECGRCGARRTDGQLGLEATPDEYVAAMVDVFREVRRVLRDDGTLWLNLGDSYATGTSTPSKPSPETDVGYWQRADKIGRSRIDGRESGLKAKDLVGIPWRVAFALQADGWYLRSDIIWAKPNPMPESVTDRPTKSHEYLFLLSKSARYFWDADAVREDGPTYTRPAGGYTRQDITGEFKTRGGFATRDTTTTGRNIRSVWTVATAPYPGAHFATFPPKLVEPCIKAGCPPDGVVLDPFAGTGTVGMVAQQLSRRAVLIDLNPDYLRQCLARNAQTPLGLPA